MPDSVPNTASNLDSVKKAKYDRTNSSSRTENTSLFLRQWTVLNMIAVKL
jgi:hypothetical protein